MLPMPLSVALDLAAERAREAHEAARRDALVRNTAPVVARPSAPRVVAVALRALEAAASVVAVRAAAAASRLERRVA